MCPTEIRLADGHAAAAPPPVQGLGDKIASLLLARSPLGLLVRWVAGIRASVHAKLLGAFMLVALLLIAMTAMSLQTIARLSRQSQLLDQAHARVDSSREIQHALAMQMNFTGMALLLRDEGTIAKILRENNRFNSTLERIEQAAAPEELEMIQRIRLAQDEVLTIVADLANLIRDGKLNEAMTLHLASGYPLYQRIEELVDQVVRTEQDKMQNLRSSAAGVHQRALVLMGGFAGASILLARRERRDRRQNASAGQDAEPRRVHPRCAARRGKDNKNPQTLTIISQFHEVRW